MKLANPSPRCLHRYLIILIKTIVCTALAACDAATPTPTVPSIAVTLVVSPTAVRIDPTRTPTPAPTATPEPPKVATIQLQDQLSSLHPFYVTTASAQAVLAAIYVGCVGEDEHALPVALGCEQVPTLANAGAKFVGEGLDRYLELTFKIRAGWRWTDGMPVTTQDVLLAWQTIMSPESNLRDPLTQKIYSMKALDERTLVVDFMSAAQARAAASGALTGDVAFEYFSQLGDYVRYAQQETPLADPQYWGVVRWLPAHILKDIPIKDQLASPFAAQPVGDGAFELTKVTPDSALLRRAAAPFPLGKPVFEQLEFVSPEAFQLRADARQLTLPVDEPAQTTDSTHIDWDAPTVEQLLLNVDRAPFEDVKVRQALAHAIDHERVLRDVLSLARVSPVTPTLSFDVGKSAALLAEAGWDCATKPCRKTATNARGVAISQTLEFTLVTSERLPRNLIAQSIQRQLAEVGFAVNVQIVFGLGAQSKLFAPYDEGGVLLTRDFDAALYRAPDTQSLRGSFDCASIPNERQHDPGFGNASGYCDAAFDQRMADAENGEVVLVPDKYSEVLRELRSTLETAAPVVKLYMPHQSIQVRGIAGLKPSARLPLTWNVWEWRTE